MSRLGPAEILDVQPSGDGSYVRFPDGREMVDADIVMPGDQIEQMRQGYRCIRCLEPQSEAFPPLCESTLPNGQHWCNYPIREKQPLEFAQRFGGEEHVGSRINLADEQTRLDEVTEYESRTGIILPDHVKFPDGPI